METERVSIGIIIAARGIRGEMKIRLFSSDSRRLDGVSRLFLTSPDRRVCSETTIERLRYIDGHPVIVLAGCSTRDQAESLRSWSLELPMDEIVDVDEDEFFWHDLIGSAVVGVDGQRYGIVKNIIETGSNDVLVSSDDCREYLIPILRSVIKHVSPADREILIDPLPGLFSDNDED